MRALFTPSIVGFMLLAALVGGIGGYALGVNRSIDSARMSITTNDKATQKVSAGRAGQGTQRTGTSKGESGYQLTLDVPQFARQLSARDARLIQWFRDTNEADYERLLSSYGLDPAERRSLMEHITKIYQAKIEARKHTSQLMIAQSEFDEKMKLLLGEKFSDYVEYEKRKPIREESGFLAEHLQRAGAGLTDSQRLALEKLLAKNEAFSSKTIGGLGGPRGNVPPQAYGAEAIAALERDQAALSLRSASLLREAQAAGLTSAQITALESYYRTELDNYDRFLKRTDPPLRTSEKKRPDGS